LLHHHAKRIYHVTPKFVHGMVAGAFVGILVVTGLKASGMVSALSISSPRDCDSNAVITCGALTTSELQTRYKNAGVSSIYNYFKISSKDISNISKTAESGRVYKDGKVTINGVIVATGAVTAGRENISGSTKVTSGTVTFYTRQPKVSFNPDYINAFVVMESGQFKFAILGACGNPVKATPIPKKTTPTPSPTPTPTPSAPTPPVTPPTEETPTPTPTPPTTTSTQTPPSTPIVTLASSEKAPVTLPDTGPEQIILIAALAIIGGYFFHAGHRHVRHKHAHRT
jgi:cell division septation protein DedD